jgi:drug/metabolite transporter (DMT)-like permease
MLIICAVGYGAQIITVDSVSDKVDGVKLSCIQFGITALIATILMLIFEKPDMEVIKANALPLLYSGVLSGGAAFTLQIIGQKHCNHILAPLLMSLESVFSGLADWVIRGNLPTQREFIGFAVMFVAIIMAQLPDFKFNKKPKK